MHRVNLFSPEFDHSSERDGYRWQAARLGAQLGAARVGATLYELGDDERSFPYHAHQAMEEWLLVVAGSPVLRTPDGERVLRAGDVACFPAAGDGAHQLRGPGTVLMFSTIGPLEVIEYLDSGKVGVMPLRKIFRADDTADYWDGE